MKQIYWGVMRGSVKKFPLSLERTYHDAHSIAFERNKVTKDRWWVQRFEVHLKGKAIDIYKHEYKRK